MTTESKPDEILSAPTETEMNDRRAAACIFELRDAIDRLTERCAAYKGQIEAGAKRIEMAEAELNETWADETGVVWRRPTAWAYAKACAALHKHEAENARLAKEVEENAMISQEICDSYARENQQFHDRFTAAEAALSEARAEGWRQGIEAAARVADGFTCGGCGMDGKSSAAIRALPLPVSGVVEGGGGNL